MKKTKKLKKLFFTIGAMGLVVAPVAIGVVACGTDTPAKPNPDVKVGTIEGNKLSDVDLSKNLLKDKSLEFIVDQVNKSFNSGIKEFTQLNFEMANSIAQTASKNYKFNFDGKEMINYMSHYEAVAPSPQEAIVGYRNVVTLKNSIIDHNLGDYLSINSSGHLIVKKSFSDTNSRLNFSYLLRMFIVSKTDIGFYAGKNDVKPKYNLGGRWNYNDPTIKRADIAVGTLIPEGNFKFSAANTGGTIAGVMDFETLGHYMSDGKMGSITPKVGDIVTITEGTAKKPYTIKVTQTMISDWAKITENKGKQMNLFAILLNNAKDADSKIITPEIYGLALKSFEAILSSKSPHKESVAKSFTLVAGTKVFTNVKSWVNEMLKDPSKMPNYSINDNNKGLVLGVSEKLAPSFKILQTAVKWSGKHLERPFIKLAANFIGLNSVDAQALFNMYDSSA